ncbi:MAG: L,D-transpeptidase [Longimicrobiales bacterium]
MRISNRRLYLILFLACVPVAAAVLTRSHVVERIRAYRAPVRLKVDLSDRRLFVIEGGEVVRSYGVAIGTRRHPTPTGHFRTGRIVWNPGWVPPNSEWARGERPRAPGDPANPMKGVKIYFREPAYFIHGTNDPGSIGSAASHGCLRMHVGEAKSLANLIEEYGSLPLQIQP